MIMQFGFPQVLNADEIISLKSNLDVFNNYQKIEN